MTGLELGGRPMALQPGLCVIIASGYSAAMAGSQNPLPDGMTFSPKPFRVAEFAQSVRETLDRRA
jgi:hypothetical protein